MVGKSLKYALSLLMLRTSLKGKYGMMKTAEEHDLTLMQAMALCLLDPDTGIPMNSLSRYLTCDPSNVTSIVDRLVEAKLIERTESERDRRIKMITLTEAGLALREELLGIATENRFPAIDTLSNEEMHTLIALITKAMGSGSVDAAD
jgi:DNA-binding MarR family transcriptional regulator